MTVNTSEELRAALVAELVRSRLVRTEAVREAFAAVPREIFVPRLAAVRGLAEIYANDALVTQERGGLPTSSSSQPTIMAIMLEALAVRRGHRVLEVGLGTGYNAALLSTLVGSDGHVASVDIDAGIVAEAAEALQRGGYRVTTVTADGRQGHGEQAPYDRIIVTASGPSVPRAWWEQLAPDGILVMPLRIDAMQIIATLRRTQTGFRSSQLDQGGFMALRRPGPDGQPVADDDQAVMSLRAAIPGRGTVQLFANGPALGRVPPERVVDLIAALLRGPSETTSVDPVPAGELVWHTIMTGEVDRQLGIFDVARGARFGYANAETGGCSLLASTRSGDQETVSTIETYGDDPTGPQRLQSSVEDWRRRGSPELGRLAIQVDYRDSPHPEWALRTIPGDEHTLYLGWLPERSGSEKHRRRRRG